MVSLFDIARSAGGGAGFDGLSRQFGLDQAQTQRAVEALLPAFTLAFQRSAADPAAFANLIGLVGSGQFAPFYDAPRQGAGVGPMGEALVAQLFGRQDRAIASQAAAMTGIAGDVLQRMLPTLAATLLGGLFRNATMDGVADLLRQWSDAIKAAQPRPTTRAADPFSAWSETLAAMSGARPKPAPPSPVESWTAMMAAMMGAQPAPPPPPPSPRSDPYGAVSAMFETGREVQAQHLAGFQAILDTVWGKPRSSDRAT